MGGTNGVCVCTFVRFYYSGLAFQSLEALTLKGYSSAVNKRLEVKCGGQKGGGH